MHIPYQCLHTRVYICVRALFLGAPRTGTYPDNALHRQRYTHTKRHYAGALCQATSTTNNKDENAAITSIVGIIVFLLFLVVIVVFSIGILAHTAPCRGSFLRELIRGFSGRRFWESGEAGRKSASTV